MFLDFKKIAFKGGRIAAPSFAFLLAVLACLWGCQQKGGVDSKYVDLYVELRIVETTYGNESPMARLVRQNTLKKYGYTRERFLEETEALLADDARWVDFQKTVVDRIDTLLNPPKVPAAAPAAKNPPPQAMPPRKGGVQ